MEIEHPAVDWSTLGRNRWDRVVVVVTCIDCGVAAGHIAAGVRHRLRTGNFTGRCTLCATRFRFGLPKVPLHVDK